MSADAPLLSATLIVRDEDRVLGRCLGSLQRYVDEIVVVDTGSRDRTVEIARQFGAIVHHHPWTDDFAAARNHALKHATGRWAFYIDADEEVVEGDPLVLRERLRDPVYILHTVGLRLTADHTLGQEYRIFRNDPRIRFRGCIHETMLPDVRALIAAEGYLVGRSGLSIEHSGYHGDLAHKHVRNIPLLRRRLAEQPDHVYCWHHLGQSLAGQGDSAAAREAWTRGIGVVRAKAERKSTDILPYNGLLHDWVDGGGGVSPLLEEARGLFPEDPGLIALHARALVNDERFDSAISMFEALMRFDIGTLETGRLSYRRDMFSRLPNEGLGLCHFRLGNFASSAEHYRLALAAGPSTRALEARLRLVELRMSRSRNSALQD